MIKFVCANCGERLSVPDAHGGKKGACPTCHAVNQIPLKGYAETQPRSPVIARPATKPPQAEEPGLRQAKPEETSSQPAVSSTLRLRPEGSAVEPKPAAASTAAPAAEPHNSAPGSTSLTAGSTQHSALPASPAPESSAFSVQRSEFSVSPSRFTSPDKVVTPPDNEAFLRTMRRARQESTRPAAMTPTMATRPRKELRLPKPAKIALLILAALAFV
ncbi:MAG: hypothetical protein JWM97_2592, partial [Phycisphaerales bacterium]|nr:hypothetical protein [Phycisphaerales bacterium]